MPTLAEIDVAWKSDVAERARAAEQALLGAASATDQLASKTTTLDQPLQRVGRTFEAVQRQLDGSVAATRRITAAQEEHDRKVRTIIATYEKGDITFEKAQGYIANLAILLEQATAKAVAHGHAVEGRLTAAYGQLAGSTSRSTAEYQRLLGIFDPVTASAQRMAAELQDLNEAHRIGITIAGGYAKAEAAIIERHNEGAQSARRRRAEEEALTRTLIERGRAEQTAANGQSMWNRYAGVSDPSVSAGSARQSASAFEEMFQAEEKAVKAQAELNAQARQWIAVAQPSIAAQEQLNEQRALGQRLMAAGVITQAQFNLGMDAMGKASGSTAFAMRNLGVQSIDVFQQLASGAPVMMTLVQQGGQIAQVAAASGSSLGQMAKGAVGALFAINPLVLAAVAVTAAIVAVGVAAESSARQVQQLSVRLRATRDDYDAVAQDITVASKAIASSTRFSGADARAAGLAIGNSPGFRGSVAEMEALIRTAGDLAAVMGKTLPEAASDLAQSLTEPAAAAKRMADQSFPGMSQALAYEIKLMADAGDKAGAFARYLGVVERATKGAADTLTPLQKSVNELGNAFTAGINGGKSLAEMLGSAITGAAALAVSSITAVVNSVAALTGAVGSAVDWATRTSASSGLAPAGSAVLENGGHVGMFQVSEAAARDIGMNPAARYRYQDNITAGVSYFRKLLDQSGGNIDFATRAYNQGFLGASSGGGASYLSAVTRQTPSALSDPVQSDIARAVVAVFSDYTRQADIPAIMDRAAQIALQESGGSHFGNAASSTSRRTEQYGPPAPPSSVRDDAFSAYLSSGVLSLRRDQNRTQQRLLQAGIMEAVDPDEVARLSEALAKLRGEETDLITEQDKLARSAVDATRTLAAQEGWARSMAEVDQQFAIAARAAGKAVDEKKLAIAKAAEQTKLAAEYEDLVAATNRTTESQERIAAAYDGTEQSISRATNRERALAEARRKYNPETADFAGHVDDLAAAYDRSTAASRNFQLAQQSVSALMDTLSNAVDRIGQGIVDAFLSGSGAAVNFGNIARSVVASVASDFVKMALLNPLKNDLLGTTQPTLSAAYGALSGGGAAGNASSGGSLLSAGSNVLSLGRITDSLGFTNIGGQLSNLGQTLGLTGPDGILSGLSSGISGLLNAPIFGASALTGATNSALAGMGGALGPATASQVGVAGATFGSVLGGIGGGFALGSLGGGLLQSALGKVGPGPTIGAGIGAAGGTAAGVALIPVLGPLGPIIGGLLGGILGGGGGGLIGPKKATPFSATGLTVDSSGLLGVGRTISQIVNTQAEVETLNQQVAQINAVLAATGTRIANATSVDEFGQNRLSGGNTGTWLNYGQGGGRPSDIAATFGELRFDSADSVLSRQLRDRSFADIGALQSAITEVRTFVDQTAPTLIAMGDTTKSFGEGSLATQIAALEQQYDAAIAVARRLGEQEEALTTARENAIAAVRRAPIEALQATDTGLEIRFLRALAANDDNPAMARDAAIMEFDARAKAERDGFRETLLGLLGDAGEGTALYVDQMARLDRALYQERVQLLGQFNDQMLAQESQAQAQAVAQRQSAEQAALGVVTSLAEYARGLAYSDASPLSAQAQLDLAQREFQAVSGAAVAGDFASIQRLPEISDAVLAAAREVYGSGTGYVQAFDQVRSILETLANKSTDSIVEAAVQQSGRNVVVAIETMQDRLDRSLQDLRNELRQQTLMPARVRQ